MKDIRVSSDQRPMRRPGFCPRQRAGRAWSYNNNEIGLRLNVIEILFRGRRRAWETNRSALMARMGNKSARPRESK